MSAFASLWGPENMTDRFARARDSCLQLESVGFGEVYGSVRPIFYVWFTWTFSLDSLTLVPPL